MAKMLVRQLLIFSITTQTIMATGYVAGGMVRNAAGNASGLAGGSTPAQNGKIGGSALVRKVAAKATGLTKDALSSTERGTSSIHAVVVDAEGLAEEARADATAAQVDDSLIRTVNAEYTGRKRTTSNTRAANDGMPVCLIGQFCDADEHGLSATLVKTVVQALRCESRGTIPYVYWEASRRPDYCNPAVGSECFSSYFKPSLTKPELIGRQALCHDEENSFIVHEYSPVVISNNFALRAATERIFAQYFELQPLLESKVDAFRHRHFEGAVVIGVHVRMGDGAEEFGQAAIPVKTYIEKCDSLVRELQPNASPIRFFVASNSPTAVREFRAHFGEERVLSSQAPTVPDEKHASSVGCGVKEVGCADDNAHGILMDIWLLSLSDHFVFWQTSTAWAVLLKRAGLTSHQVGPPPEVYNRSILDMDAKNELEEHLHMLRKTVPEMNRDIGEYLLANDSVARPECGDCVVTRTNLGTLSLSTFPASGLTGDVRIAESW